MSTSAPMVRQCSRIRVRIAASSWPEALPHVVADTMTRAATASMTASTFFRRSRTLALRVRESRQGVFLYPMPIQHTTPSYRFRETYHSKPELAIDVGLNAPKDMVTVAVRW